MPTNSSSSNINSGTGKVTATIDNDFAYPIFSAVPRFFVHGNNKVILRTIDYIDKAGHQTGINFEFPEGIENRRYEFNENDPASLVPPGFTYRSFNEVLKEWVSTSYLKEHEGYIDIKDFDLRQGYLKADFSFQFTTYENPKVHKVSGTIDVAGLEEDK